ncbi:uncharacterized protein LOC143425776 [Xylocopa sonorina]|uniref:uncharacterized protein LOC143425776 n=1 Tax=Xylocopa sonorina TaxID=1818115 RepID=UPI00403A9E49
MKRGMSSHSHCDEKLRSSRIEEGDTGLRSRIEDERLRRRREWEIQQKKEREHERLKKKMILEFEMRRAREKGLPLPKIKDSHHSRSKSRSRSPKDQHRRTAASSMPMTSILSKKLESSSGTTPLFRGPEGTEVSAAELRRIKVDIHRDIPGKTATTGELQRDIVAPENVMLKRREGEGSKPIFEREEIKIIKTEETKELRTVVAIDSDNLDYKSKTSKKYTASPNRSRSRSHSPRRTSSRYSRHEGSKHNDRETSRSSRERYRSRHRSREYNERSERRGRSHDDEQDKILRERQSHQDRSYSMDTRQERWDRNSRNRTSRNNRSYRDYRGRSRERSRDRAHRDRSRERRIPHYIEQIPVPIYYSNFPPRPMMVGPLVPIREQVPLGGSRHPPIMSPFGPFPPRFIPPNMYRFRPPPTPRFGPMY